MNTFFPSIANFKCTHSGKQTYA